MFVRDLFRLSFHNLLLHKVRSMLTSLGVIFGVGSVIAMLAISEGAKRTSLAQIEAMGIDKVIVYSRKPPVTGKNESSSQASVAEAYGLDKIDLANLSKMDNIEHITKLRNARKKILKGSIRLDLMLVAVPPQFLEDSHSRITKGRWFSSIDMKNKTPVCVLGKSAKRKLFSIGARNIIGHMLRVEQKSYRVIGILENSHDMRYPELDNPNNMILIPWTVSMANYGFYSFMREGRQLRIANIQYDCFIVKVIDTTHIDDTAKRIAGYLKKAHKHKRDWGMVVPLDLLKQKEQTQNIFTIVMSSIASISLIVGGIGIMNIMLANVYERRKEIGTRLALGAQKNHILFQFLIETVFLTTMGGVIGIFLGLGMAQAVTYYADWPTIYSWWSIALSMLISSFVGIVFGTYPAWKAAQQNPIEVLRAE
jgi:putative ABC transport system permease protein